MSVCPWNRRSTFHSVWQCREHTTRRHMQPPAGRCGPPYGRARRRSCAPASQSVLRRRRPGTLRGDLRHAVRQRDGGAVLPEALERVEGAVLLVLDVHDDVDEVEEDPAALALALAADRLDIGL